MIQIYNSFTVQGWMLKDLKLSGNKLIIFALIHEATQFNQDNYNLSFSDFEELLNISRPTISTIIKELESLKYITIKRELYRENIYKSNLKHLSKLLNSSSKEILPDSNARVKKFNSTSSKEILHQSDRAQSDDTLNDSERIIESERDKNDEIEAKKVKSAFNLFSKTEIKKDNKKEIGTTNILKYVRGKIEDLELLPLLENWIDILFRKEKIAMSEIQFDLNMEILDKFNSKDKKIEAIKNAIINGYKNFNWVVEKEIKTYNKYLHNPNKVDTPEEIERKQKEGILDFEPLRDKDGNIIYY